MLTGLAIDHLERVFKKEAGILRYLTLMDNVLICDFHTGCL